MELLKRISLLGWSSEMDTPEFAGQVKTLLTVRFEDTEPVASDLTLNPSFTADNRNGGTECNLLPYPVLKFLDTFHVKPAPARISLYSTIALLSCGIPLDVPKLVIHYKGFFAQVSACKQSDAIRQEYWICGRGGIPSITHLSESFQWTPIAGNTGSLLHIHINSAE